MSAGVCCASLPTQPTAHCRGHSRCHSDTHLHSQHGQVRGYGYRCGHGAGMGWHGYGYGYGMVWYSVVRYCMVWYGMSSSSLPAHFRKRNSNTKANSKEQTATETYSYTCPCTCPYTSTRPVPLPFTTGCMSSPPLGVDLQAIISVGEGASYCVITMWL